MGDNFVSVGNVQGVLVRGNQVYKLTKEHTPYNDKEQNRVLKMGKQQAFALW